MTKLCLLITKPPRVEEQSNRMYGISARALERGFEVAIYLLGDGVLCAKKDQKGHIGNYIKNAIENGAVLNASSKDLLARGILREQVEPGINIVDDFEHMFVKDVMENSNRVISW